MSDLDDIDRGRLAEEVLNNSVYQGAYETIEKEVIRSWREAKNTEDREQLHRLLGLLAKVKTATESVMRTGQLAQESLRQKQTLAQRATGKLREFVSG